MTGILSLGGLGSLRNRLEAVDIWLDGEFPKPRGAHAYYG